ncbi:hypothetical protein VNO77_03680 [Canavalia gladiata]|uniref:Uncharacterized protein n=1 Tax=Canavalia gladiata TaxID=3824 RepID=A0AAN9R455_CANGL
MSSRLQASNYLLETSNGDLLRSEPESEWERQETGKGYKLALKIEEIPPLSLRHRRKDVIATVKVKITGKSHLSRASFTT